MHKEGDLGCEGMNIHFRQKNQRDNLGCVGMKFISAWILEKLLSECEGMDTHPRQKIEGLILRWKGSYDI